MHLRHIRPRSVDWYDALLEEEPRGFDRLSPEENTKLRALVATERSVFTARQPPQRAMALPSAAAHGG